GEPQLPRSHEDSESNSSRSSPGRTRPTFWWPGHGGTVKSPSDLGEGRRRQEVVRDFRHRVSVLRIVFHLVPGGMLSESAPMFLVGVLVFAGEHVGQMGEVGADERLAVEYRA